MNRLAASFLTLSLLTLSCSLSAPTPLPSGTAEVPSATATEIATAIPVANPLETPWDDFSLFKAGLVPSAYPALDKLKDASVYHIDLTLADDLFHVTGVQDVRYTNTEEVPLSEIHFRLFPNILGGSMEVSNIQVDESPVAPTFALADSVMIVPLAEPLQPGQSVVVHVDFVVIVPQSLELNYGVLAYANDVLALAHAYPMIAVYDDEGWNEEIPPQSGDVTYADASFFIVRVTAPAGVTLVTSGYQVRLDEEGQAQVLNVAAGPARDFYLAASPLYVESSVTVGEVTIRSFAPSDAQAGSDKVLAIAEQSVKVFSERYAPYPYTELDIVSTPTLALGIEYPGIVAITSWTYDVSDPSVLDYLEGTVAHEVGHQWFYNLVGDDQLDDPWLDESLTQFATLQYYIDTYGAEGEAGFTNSLLSRWGSVGNEPMPIGLPVANYSGAEYSAIVYGRGPLFFVALQEEMGTDAFDAFIKDYTQTYSWGIATPETLHQLAEHHCGCDLDELFNDWVYP